MERSTELLSCAATSTRKLSTPLRDDHNDDDHDDAMHMPPSEYILDKFQDRLPIDGDAATDEFTFKTSDGWEWRRDPNGHLMER